MGSLKLLLLLHTVVFEKDSKALTQTEMCAHTQNVSANRRWYKRREVKSVSRGNEMYFIEL